MSDCLLKQFNSSQSPVVIAPPHLSPDFIRYTVDPYGGVLTEDTNQIGNLRYKEVENGGELNK